VAVIEYAGFECSACARFAKELKPALVREDIDTGRVKFVPAATKNEATISTTAPRRRGAKSSRYSCRDAERQSPIDNQQSANL
jgi:hypothetical protein